MNECNKNYKSNPNPIFTYFPYWLHRKEYYIIRYGNFATNCNIKLFYGMLSLCLGVGDYVTSGSTDCFKILLGSTATWSGVELYLHTSGTRVIKPMTLKVKGYSYTIPLWTSLIVQGLQEGGLITTLGLYFGDRIREPESIIMFHVFLLFSIINVCAQKNLPKSSRRMVNTRASLSFIGSVTLYDLYVLSYIEREVLHRQISMFMVMVYFSAWWTCATWWVGSRGVEVVDTYKEKWKSNNQCNQCNNVHEAISTPMYTALVLAYDVVFEIGFAYLIFYNLFVL